MRRAPRKWIVLGLGLLLACAVYEFPAERKARIHREFAKIETVADAERFAAKYSRVRVIKQHDFAGCLDYVRCYDSGSVRFLHVQTIKARWFFHPETGEKKGASLEYKTKFDVQAAWLWLVDVVKG